jgi:hypothetical protein
LLFGRLCADANGRKIRRGAKQGNEQNNMLIGEVRKAHLVLLTIPLTASILNDLVFGDGTERIAAVLARDGLSVI